MNLSAKEFRALTANLLTTSDIITLAFFMEVEPAEYQKWLAAVNTGDADGMATLLYDEFLFRGQGQIITTDIIDVLTQADMKDHVNTLRSRIGQYTFGAGTPGATSATTTSSTAPTDISSTASTDGIISRERFHLWCQRFSARDLMGMLQELGFDTKQIKNILKSTTLAGVARSNSVYDAILSIKPQQLDIINLRLAVTNMLFKLYLETALSAPVQPLPSPPADMMTLTAFKAFMGGIDAYAEAMASRWSMPEAVRDNVHRSGDVATATEVLYEEVMAVDPRVLSAANVVATGRQMGLNAHVDIVLPKVERIMAMGI